MWDGEKMQLINLSQDGMSEKCAVGTLCGGGSGSGWW
jgi:hypothetical protein